MALPPVAPPMRSVAGNGMVVDRTGSGPPVLLVHGVGGPIMWEKLVPLLARSREVIVPHLPGFGESPAPEKPMSPADHAAAIRTLVDTAGPGRISIAGVSYGGEVASNLATLAAGKADRLVLVCPTGAREAGKGGPARRWLRGTLGSDRYRSMKIRMLSSPVLAEFSSRRSFFDISNRPPDLVARYLEQLSRPGHAETLFDTLRGIAAGTGATMRLVERLPLPVILVAGKNDRVIAPPATPPPGESGYRRDLRILEECGHSVPMEKPAELTRIIAGEPP